MLILAANYDSIVVDELSVRPYLYFFAILRVRSIKALAIDVLSSNLLRRIHGFSSWKSALPTLNVMTYLRLGLLSALVEIANTLLATRA